MPATICRHIRANGTRCHSFALRDRAFCFHHENAAAHQRTLRPLDDGTDNVIHPLNLAPGQLQREPLVAEYYASARGPLHLNFPPLEDADSV
jgi:hypothetical protein